VPRPLGREQAITRRRSSSAALLGLPYFCSEPLALSRSRSAFALRDFRDRRRGLRLPVA
jgi:hypothetical protein